MPYTYPSALICATPNLSLSYGHGSNCYIAIAMIDRQDCGFTPADFKHTSVGSLDIDGEDIERDLCMVRVNTSRISFPLFLLAKPRV